MLLNQTLQSEAHVGRAEKALATMESAVEQMQRINALDHRTLTVAGVG